MGRSNLWLMVGAVLTLASMFLVNPNSYLLAQAPATPARFFEAAKTSLSTDPARMQPPAGMAMRSLTAAQSVDSLRNYMATGDVGSMLASNDAAAKTAGDKLQRVLRDPSIQSAQLVAFDLKKMEASALGDTPSRLCQGPEPYCSVIRSWRWDELSGGVQRLFANIGGTEGKPHGQAIFIREDGNVHGVLTIGGLTYLMRQLTGAIFVVTTPRTERVERVMVTFDGG